MSYDTPPHRKKNESLRTPHGHSVYRQGFAVVAACEREEERNMAQANGSSPPPLGGAGSSSVQKRAREESAGDVGDTDEARGHCRVACTVQENREAAIDMLPNANPTKTRPCNACGKDVTGVSRAAVDCYCHHSRCTKNNARALSNFIVVCSCCALLLLFESLSDPHVQGQCCFFC